MFNLNQRIRFRVSGRTILIVLSSVVLIHLLVMALYINENRYALRAASRDAMIQKIINAIHLVNATPVANRKTAMQAVDDPSLKISLTSEPTWSLRFHQISFWEINRELRIRKLGSFAISIRLTDGQWLNCKARKNDHILLSQLLLITLELMMAAAILASAWSIHTFTRPLARFKKAAEQLGVGTPAQPLIEYGPAIVRETAEAMNQMQQRISDLIRDRTQMLAAISHDLRTPITRIQLRIQINDGKRAIDEKNLADLAEMDAMISQTLAFAKEDPMREALSLIDLHSLLATLCEDMSDIGLAVQLDTSLRQLPYKCRPLSLKRALSNLINNALKYGKTAAVSLKRQRNQIHITILDQGPGIPDQDLGQVFRPFYRGDHSRSRDTGGVGLGLAVTRDIIRAHNGKLTLENRPAGGLKVSIVLPIA